MPLLLRAIFEDQIECFQLMVNEGADLLAADQKDECIARCRIIRRYRYNRTITATQTELINSRTTDGLPINLCESNEVCAYLLQAEVKFLKTMQNYFLVVIIQLG